MKNYQFSSCGHILEGKKPDPDVPVDGPLLSFAVRVAGVVHEAGDVALVAGIDHSPIRNKTNYVLNDLRVSLNNILTT